MKYVIYYRVSTQKQGFSKLGLEAQQIAVNDYLKNKSDVEVIGEFTEIISGKVSDRRQLNQAIALAKKNNATIVVAKIDRLARNLMWFLELINTVRLLFVDFPNLDPNDPDDRMVLVNIANMAEWEANKISQRTKQALQAKKARGEPMGVTGSKHIKSVNEQRTKQADEFARSVAPVIKPLIGTMTQKQMIEHLNARHIKSPTGKQWVLCTLQNVIKRINALDNAPSEPPKPPKPIKAPKTPRKAKTPPHAPHEPIRCDKTPDMFTEHDWRVQGLTDEQIDKVKANIYAFGDFNFELIPHIPNYMEKFITHWQHELKDPKKLSQFKGIDEILSK